MKKLQYSLILSLLFCLCFNRTFAQVQFTQEDRDLLIRTETKMEVGFEQIDKRFEQIDKRFEQVDKRIEQTNTYMGWMIALFGGMFATTVIFALWDRRTMVRPFESKVREIEDKIAEVKNDKTNKIDVASLARFS